LQVVLRKAVGGLLGGLMQNAQGLTEVIPGRRRRYRRGPIKPQMALEHLVLQASVPPTGETRLGKNFQERRRPADFGGSG
jgi:hypothetical protein